MTAVIDPTVTELPDSLPDEDLVCQVGRGAYDDRPPCPNAATYRTTHLRPPACSSLVCTVHAKAAMAWIAYGALRGRCRECGSYDVPMQAPSTRVVPL